ncbi:hypothetical protein KL905_003596 [Ogataea polymorpha]|uniref:Uncharacterized protein n=2 Tax=Ogataea polymorpha TaxID=460523 RepID=A0A9P8SZR9_9ASCO|nr:hypothetical protein KL937_003422 [Ogataea polymorpha]KAG7892072.1 hypothetical protein KL908_003677 [Ogataea polymorpha]KAG7899328.1 hypothetical protein KL935_003638 [Ogataea polymorpha]KAG7904544.1 hypothetical protein KL907_003420 [Ogataea polymorpha]KAG7907679.1 hypothetical protein KL906_003760 [Ogataea polymorpha]
MSSPTEQETKNNSMNDEARAFVAKQMKPVVLPSFARWFDMNEIHEIEKRSLPEFFNNESRFKTPKVYKEYRDFMIHTYRLNPMEYLTVTAARRGLAGDVASIIRVHGFLCKWGLINYQIDPKTKPVIMGPQFTGHFQITLDKPTGLEAHIPVKKESDEVEEKTEESAEKATNNSFPLNLEIRKNVYDTAQDAFALKAEDTAKNGLKQFFCSITGNEITETRYHNLKTKQNISKQAFEDGQFPAAFKSSDYVKLEKSYNRSDARPWTDQETLLLLEAIEMYRDDWTAISGHVGTRTKEQCISRFIQLPIEDKYLEKQLSESTYQEFLKQSSKPTGVVDAINNSIKQMLEQDNEALAKVAANSQLQLQQETAAQDALISQIMALSLKQFELKFSKLQELDNQLQAEKRKLALEKHNLVVDRLALRKQTASVRQKLLKASELGATDEGLMLCEEAMMEATRAPRVVVTNKTSELGTTKGDNIPEKVSLNEDFEPISVKEPQLYSMWSQ